MKKMKCAMFYGPKDLKVEEVEIPTISDEDILIKVKVALTCGTDLKTYLRGHPTLFQGRLPAPFGHEFSGDIVEIGKNVTKDIRVGDRVVCNSSAPCGYCFYCKLGEEELCENITFNNGSYSQYIIIPKMIVDKNLYVIPDDVSYEAAAILEPLACALHGIEDSRIKAGDKVAINGAGPLGSMLVKLATLKGAFVISTDINKERLQFAKKMGAKEVIHIEEGLNPVESVKNLTEGNRGVDVAIEATGIPEVWENTIKMVRKGGVANLFGGCKSGTNICIDTRIIHYNEVSIIGSYHSRPLHVKKAFELIKNHLVNGEDFISGEKSLEELETTLVDKIGKQKGIKYKIDINP